MKKIVKAVKKPIESFVEHVKKQEPPKDKPIPKEQILCDCGQPVHPGSNQCWACAHRS